MTITETIQAINEGQPIEQAIPAGADVAYWKKMVANHNYLKANPKRRRRQPRHNGQPKKSICYAALSL